MSVVVQVPQVLSAGQRRAVARLYLEAFRRKMRATLGARRERFVARQLTPSRLLLATDRDEVVGMAGLRYDGFGFLDPPTPAFRREYPLTWRWREAGWRWAHTSPRPDQVLLEGLAVRADRRGHGVGSLLLAAVEQHAHRLGKSAVILEVVDTNPRAAALYARSGYRTVHTHRRHVFRLAGFRAADLMLKQA